MSQSERIEMRVSADLKSLAERASAASGYRSLTEYLTYLITTNAPKDLEQQSVITLTNKQFDRFVEICNDADQKPSKRIMEAARRLDEEGY